MPITEDKIYGPEPETAVSPQVLCERLRQGLERRGVKFSDDAMHEHVLQAAIDYVVGHDSDGQQTDRQAQSRCVPRSTVIATAIAEHKKIGQVTSLQAFMNQSLVDAGYAPLSSDELLTIPCTS